MYLVVCLVAWWVVVWVIVWVVYLTIYIFRGIKRGIFYVLRGCLRMGRGRYRVDEVGGDGGRVRGEVDGVVDGVIDGVVERVEGLIKDVEGVLGVWVVPYFVKQFLEGVLRELFQFLIGRLATEILSRPLTSWVKFQFLIGRLATKVKKEILKKVLRVSIPYR